MSASLGVTVEAAAPVKTRTETVPLVVAVSPPPPIMPSVMGGESSALNNNAEDTASANASTLLLIIMIGAASACVLLFVAVGCYKLGSSRKSPITQVDKFVASSTTKDDGDDVEVRPIVHNLAETSAVELDVSDVMMSVPAPSYEALAGPNKGARLSEGEQSDMALALSLKAAEDEANSKVDLQVAHDHELAKRLAAAAEAPRGQRGPLPAGLPPKAESESFV